MQNFKYHAGSLGTGVTGGCGPHDVGAGKKKKPRSSLRIISALSCKVGHLSSHEKERLDSLLVVTIETEVWDFPN